MALPRITSRLTSLPLIGTGGSTLGVSTSVERRLNCYLSTSNEGGGKDLPHLHGRPGMTKKISLNNNPGDTINCLFGTNNNILAITSNSLYVLDPNLNILSIQFPIYYNINSIPEISNNGTGFIIVTGNGIYSYDNINGLLLLSPSDPNISLATSATYIDGYFVVSTPSSGFFYVSNLFSTTFNPLAFSSPSSERGSIIAVDELSDNLIIFSSRHVEFWQNVGNIPQPFLPMKSASVRLGLASASSRKHVSSGIIFLGIDESSTLHVYSIYGMTISKVSDSYADYLLSTNVTNPSSSEALTYTTSNGHSIYQLSFPIDDFTICLDITSGTWFEAQTGVALNKRATRQMARFSANTGIINVISDSISTNLYILSDTLYTDNGVVIPREFITQFVTDGGNLIQCGEVTLDMDVGLGSASPNLTMEVSYNNGRTWTTEKPASIGVLGKYLTRVSWRRLGSGRNLSFRFRTGDQVPFNVNYGSLNFSVRERPIFRPRIES
jgi:hypothetical protein